MSHFVSSLPFNTVLKRLCYFFSRKKLNRKSLLCLPCVSAKIFSRLTAVAHTLRLQEDIFRTIKARQVICSTRQQTTANGRVPKKKLYGLAHKQLIDFHSSADHRLRSSLYCRRSELRRCRLHPNTRCTSCAKRRTTLWDRRKTRPCRH